MIWKNREGFTLDTLNSLIFGTKGHKIQNHRIMNHRKKICDNNLHQIHSFELFSLRYVKERTLSKKFSQGKERS